LVTGCGSGFRQRQTRQQALIPAVVRLKNSKDCVFWVWARACAEVSADHGIAGVVRRKQAAIHGGFDPVVGIDGSFPFRLAAFRDDIQKHNPAIVQHTPSEGRPGAIGCPDPGFQDKALQPDPGPERARCGGNSGGGQNSDMTRNIHQGAEVSDGFILSAVGAAGLGWGVWDKWRGTDLSAVIPENPKGLSGTQW